MTSEISLGVQSCDGGDDGPRYVIENLVVQSQEQFYCSRKRNEVLVVLRAADSNAMRLERLKLRNASSRCNSPATNFVVFLCRELPSEGTFSEFKCNTSREAAEQLSQQLPESIVMLGYVSGSHLNHEHVINCDAREGLFIAVKFLRALGRNIDFGTITAYGEVFDPREWEVPVQASMSRDAELRFPTLVPPLHQVGLSLLGAVLNTDNGAPQPPEVLAMIARQTKTSFSSIPPGTLFGEVVTPVAPADSPVAWKPLESGDPADVFTLGALSGWTGVFEHAQPIQRVVITFAKPLPPRSSITALGFAVGGASCLFEVQAVALSPTQVMAVVPADHRQTALQQVVVRGKRTGDLKVTSVEARAVQDAQRNAPVSEAIVNWLAHEARRLDASLDHAQACLDSLFSYAVATGLPSAVLQALHSILLFQQVHGKDPAVQVGQLQIESVVLKAMEALSFKHSETSRESPFFSAQYSTAHFTEAGQALCGRFSGIAATSVMITASHSPIGWLSARLPFNPDAVQAVVLCTPAQTLSEANVVARIEGPFSCATLCVLASLDDGALSVFDNCNLVGQVQFDGHAIESALFAFVLQSGTPGSVEVTSSFPFPFHHPVKASSSATSCDVADAAFSAWSGRSREAPFPLPLPGKGMLKSISEGPASTGHPCAIAIPPGIASMSITIVPVPNDVPPSPFELAISSNGTTLWQSDPFPTDESVQCTLPGSSLQGHDSLVIVATAVGRPIAKEFACFFAAQMGMGSQGTKSLAKQSSLAKRAVALLSKGSATREVPMMEAVQHLLDICVFSSLCDAQQDADPLAHMKLAFSKAFTVEVGAAFWRAASAVIKQLARSESAQHDLLQQVLMLAGTSLRRHCVLGPSEASLVSASETVQEVKDARTGLVQSIQSCLLIPGLPRDTVHTAAALLMLPQLDLHKARAEDTTALAMTTVWPCIPALQTFVLLLQTEARMAGASVELTGAWGSQLNLVMSWNSKQKEHEQVFMSNIPSLRKIAGLTSTLCPILTWTAPTCPATWEDIALLSPHTNKIVVFTCASLENVTQSFSK